MFMLKPKVLDNQLRPKEMPNWKKFVGEATGKLKHLAETTGRMSREGTQAEMDFFVDRGQPIPSPMMFYEKLGGIYKLDSETMEKVQKLELERGTPFNADELDRFTIVSGLNKLLQDKVITEAQKTALEASIMKQAHLGDQLGR